VWVFEQHCIGLGRKRERELWMQCYPNDDGGWLDEAEMEAQEKPALAS
jgi:hypothetical protein